MGIIKRDGGKEASQTIERAVDKRVSKSVVEIRNHSFAI